MKKVLVTLFTVLAVALVASMAVPTVQAQDEAKPMTFMLGAGVGIPTGDLGDGWNLGFHGMGRLGFPVAPKLDILAGADYHFFPIDDQGDPSVDGGTLSTINLTGDLKVNLGTPAMSSNPYLLGGVGLAIERISDLSFDDPFLGPVTIEFDSETDVFIEVGVGVEFNKFFLQAKFVDIFSEGSSITYIPFTAGVKF